MAELMRLTGRQAEVYRYLGAVPHATELEIAKRVFGSRLRLGVPGCLDALRRKGLVRLRPEHDLVEGRSWERVR